MLVRPQPQSLAFHPSGEISASAQALFVENMGQFPPAARFFMYGGDHAVWLTQAAIWLTVLAPAPLTQSLAASATPAGVHLKLSFINANPQARLEPFNPQPTYFNYFRGATAAWRSNVPTWGGCAMLICIRAWIWK